MKLFYDMDLVSALKSIVCKHTFRNQVDSMKLMETRITKAAASDVDEDKFRIALVHSYGADCHKEADVFSKNKELFAYDNLTTLEKVQFDSTLAYAVEITGTGEDGKVLGRIYELDFLAFAKQVHENAMPITSMTFVPKDSTGEQGQTISFEDYTKFNVPFHLHDTKQIIHHHVDDTLFSDRLYNLRFQRAVLAYAADFKSHLQLLGDKLVDAEAMRITAAINSLNRPNSPNKTHFTIKLSEQFTRLSGTREHGKLLQAVPFSKMCLTSMKNEKGLFAMVPGDKKLKRGRKPSILAQIQEDAKAIAKKGADEKDNSKKKSTDMER